jgi:hypothetical protein
MDLLAEADVNDDGKQNVLKKTTNLLPFKQKKEGEALLFAI